MAPSLWDRRSVQAVALLVAGLSGAGCRGAAWHPGPSILAPPHRVAEALGETLPLAELDLAALPVPDPPSHTRPCCAFGMDLGVDLAGVRLPAYQVGNLLSWEQIGPHEYDNGAVTVAMNARVVTTESNGLVYTCRGGWIDTAHVRDNADLTLFLALRFARTLATGTAFDYPGDGAARRITVAPIPAEVLARFDAFAVATALAEWTAFQLSIWHELATWWGWESTPGFSERLSAFSLEDLYSNAVGIRLGAGLLHANGFRSRDEYDLAMGAWIPEALRRLGAQGPGGARAVMRSLDGRWWDSTRRLPDVLLVRRRRFPDGATVAPWRVQDAFADGEPPGLVRDLCPRSAAPLPLRVAEGIGPLLAADVVHIEWTPGAWAGATFPFPNPNGRVVRSAELAPVVAATHADMERVLGAGFDRPGPP